MTYKSDLNWEVMLAAFILGSAFIQGIVNGSLIIFIFFFMPSLVLVILQYRRTVILPSRQAHLALKSALDEIDKIKRSQSDAPKHSLADMKKITKRAKSKRARSK